MVNTEDDVAGLDASNGHRTIVDLTDYDPTADSIEIQSTVTASGNQVNVLISEASTGLSVSTSIVPHAQGWCR